MPNVKQQINDNALDQSEHGLDEIPPAAPRGRGRGGRGGRSGGGGGIPHAVLETSYKLSLGPEHGYIVYYSALFLFEATCNRNAEHTECRCRLTRTSLESDVVGREAQGRPLGLLAAWLLDDIDVTRHEHVDLFYIYGITFPQRLVGREFLESLPDWDSGWEFFERPKRDSEDSREPEDTL